MKRGYSRSRANLNGGELDCENTSGTHKGETVGPTGRVLSVKWDMYPEWLPEQMLPLPGMRGRLESEL